MSEDKALEALQLAAPFVGLAAPQIAEIARQAKRLKFMRGDIITRSGQIGDGAYLIVTGPAEQMEGVGPAAQKQPVAPGSLIGEMAMLIEHTFGTTVTANDWVYCLKITRSAMHAQMVADPTLADHFERRVTQRLTQMMEDLRRIESSVPNIPAAGAPPRQAAGPIHGPLPQRQHA